MSNTKQALSIDLKLPSTPDFVTDPALVVELQRLYNAVNTLALFVDIATGRQILSVAQKESQGLAGIRSQKLDVVYAVASATIAAGAACQLRKTGDFWTAYPAIATIPSPSTDPALFATCFCTTSGGLLTGEYGAFTHGSGLIPYIGSISEGHVYYLSSTTAGAVTTTAPTAGGTFKQTLGFALDPTHFYSNIALPIF